jgi:hypothetical protein
LRRQKRKFLKSPVAVAKLFLAKIRKNKIAVRMRYERSSRISWLSRAAVACTPHDDATVIVHQIVVVVAKTSRCSTLGGIGGIGIRGRDLLLLMGPVLPPDSVLRLPSGTGAPCDGPERLPPTARGERGSPSRHSLPRNYHPPRAHLPAPTMRADCVSASSPKSAKVPKGS